MQTRNLPSIDTRYWAAILIASILGTTLGDYVSTGLGLGYLAGLAPMAVMLAFTLGAERWSKVSTVAFYWAAIVITRTAATHLADFTTHQLNFGFGVVEAGLAALLLLTLLAVRRRALFAPAQTKELPTTNWGYWLAILLASVLGTALGDFLSNGLHLGVGRASLILGGVLPVALFAQSKIKVPREAYYWLAIVLVRTAGTTMGDWLTASDQLALSYAQASLCMAVLLFATLALTTRDGRLATFAATRYSAIKTWQFRRPLAALAIVATGLGIGYLGYNMLDLSSEQEVWYNKGVLEIRKDFEAKHPFTSFQNPDVPYLQKSILYFNNQSEAGILGRLLYGRPNVEYAAQAYLKIGVILLYNAGQDQKLVSEAKGYLEKAVELNPGIPYARDLIADVSRINALAIMALAPERNLEMLYQKNPQQRSKKPNKSKDGKGDQSQDAKPGDQKGEPDQPNDQPGEQDDKSKAEQEAPASKNNSLNQNNQDVRNGQSNDGI